MNVTTMNKPYVKLYDDPSIDRHINATSEKYDNGQMEKILGIGLCMPFESTNSASRKIMHYAQFTQKTCLLNPDVAYITTGYENLIGKYSSSFNKVDDNRNWQVIGKIERFSNVPGHHYYLFIMDEYNNIDMIERVSYCYNTESYGFLYDNSYLDNLNVGSIIPGGTTVKKSKSFDMADNYMMGHNLTTMYVSDPYTTEDAIKISESTRWMMARPEINVVRVIINDNDIPLNLYGNNQVYKMFPDIGESIEKGILCGLRTERNDEVFFAQSGDRLRKTMINDTTYKTKGKVVDVRIYCNKDISTSANGIYEGQLDYYDRDYKRFCNEVVNLLSNYIDNSDYKKSNDLEEFYTICEDVVKGKQYFNDNVFNNIIVDFVVFHAAPVQEGDKFTSRYGGKGVISQIVPDDEMPRLGDQQVDLIWNIATCINRLNLGQLFEHSLNYISKSIVDYIKLMNFDASMIIDILSRYLYILSEEYAEYFIDQMESCINDDEAMFTLGDWITEDGDGLYLAIKPISETMTFEKLLKIYEEFPWIKPQYICNPHRDSRGRIRYVESKKPGIVAKQYIYRMKQNAEEKHSATSMSATNVKGLNSKSKAAKMFIRTCANTPVRFGEMESNIFDSMNCEVHIMNLMLYSTSPQGRRNVKYLLDNYDFNVVLSDDAKSRSAEIVNCILKCKGYKFEFSKIKINYTSPFVNVGIRDNPIFVIQDIDSHNTFVRQDIDSHNTFVRQDIDSHNTFVRTDLAHCAIFNILPYKKE